MQYDETRQFFTTKPLCGIITAAILLGIPAGCKGADAQENQTGKSESKTKAETVKVEKITFCGWTNAWKVSNGACELVVIPAINRVMSFSPAGGSNILWVSPDARGQVIKKDDRQWHNLGGDKVWPTAQGLWQKYTGRNGWPPPYAFDCGIATAEAIPGGLRMTSPEDPDFGAVCVREFVMDPVEATVHIRQYYDKSKGNPVEMTFWTITQVRHPTYAMLPLGREQDGKRYRKLGGLLDSQFAVNSTVLTLKNDEKDAQKVGVAPDENFNTGWIAAYMKNDGVLFVESHKLDREPAYPDGGCHGEIFAGNKGSGMYTEIELLSPLKTLKAGDKLQHDMVWQLVRVKPGEADDAEKAGALAAGAHSAALKRL